MQTFEHQSLFRLENMAELETIRTEKSSSRAQRKKTASSTELVRCKRRSNFNNLGYTIPTANPASVARRNQRERNRVKLVNQGFTRLREHVPNGANNKKMSKVDTLKKAIDYIKDMQELLEKSAAASVGYLATNQQEMPAAYSPESVYIPSPHYQMQQMDQQVSPQPMYSIISDTIPPSPPSQMYTAVSSPPSQLLYPAASSSPSQMYAEASPSSSQVYPVVSSSQMYATEQYGTDYGQYRLADYGTYCDPGQNAVCYQSGSLSTGSPSPSYLSDTSTGEEQPYSPEEAADLTSWFSL